MIDGVVAIPCGVTARFSSFWDCVARLILPPRVVIRTGRGASPAANRNGLIEEAKTLGAQWIWFLDDDVVFHPNALMRMLEHLNDPDLECVVALSFNRRPPFQAIWFPVEAEPNDAAMLHTLQAPSGGLVSLQAATFGGMLIRMSAIAKIAKPYITIGQIRPDEWNDDLYFCRKLTAAGVKIWGDPSIRFGHTTDMEIWPHYDEATKQWAVLFARNTQPCVMLPWGEPAAELVGAE